MPYQAECESLQIEPGTPILLIRRTQLSHTGQPFEVTKIKAVAEGFETADINETAAAPDQDASAPPESTPSQP